MQNATEPPVEGDDFFGRKKELEYVWKLTKNRNNIVLPSPRRAGKTSFALKVVENAQAKGWKTIELNLEQYGDIQPYTFTLLKHLCQEKSGSKRASLLDVISAEIDPGKGIQEFIRIVQVRSLYLEKLRNPKGKD